MACEPGCDPALVSTGVDPDSEQVLALFVNETDETACYMTGARVQRWDLSGVSPTFDSALPISNGMPPITIHNNVMYVMSTDGVKRTVHAIDTTTSPPTELGTVDLAADSGTDFTIEPAVMSANGNRLYVYDTTVPLAPVISVVDITSPGAMSYLGQSTIFTGGSQVTPQAIIAESDDSTLYVVGTDTSPSNGVYIFDFSTPTAATLIGAALFSGGGTAGVLSGGILTNAAFLDGFLYCTTRGPGDIKSFTIANVSVPATPTISSTTTISGHKRTILGISVQGNLLFLNNDLSADGSPATDPGQIEVWDVTDKTAPTQCKVTALAVPATVGMIKGDLTDNIYQSVDDGFGAGSFNVYDVATCLTPTPPTPGHFNACKALGDFGGYLFIADGDELKLKIYDVSDPTNPTEVGSLDLAEEPTDIDIRASVLYVAAPPDLYAISIDVIDTPALLATVTPQSGEMVTISGRNPYTSGPLAGISVFTLVSDESSLEEIGGQPALNDGIGRPAFAKRKMIFADLADGFGTLYSAALGGFDCHHIDAGDLSSDYADFEIMRSRHALLKGDMVADTAVVYSLIQVGDRYIVHATGDPEGVIEAPKGSLALSDDGTIYVKSTA